MDWKDKAGSRPIGYISGAISALWAWERVIGLSGLPDDAAAWHDMAGVIPTPLAAAALGAFALFAWARWGDDIREWIIARLNRPNRKASPVSSLIFVATLFLIVFAVTPWLFFAAVHVMAFSFAALQWLRGEGEFWELFSAGLTAILK